MLNAVRVSPEATIHIAEVANKEGLTISEATNRLIETGFARRTALTKWRRKERRARRSHA